MRIRTHILIPTLIIGMVLGCVLWPQPVRAATVMVQTTGRLISITIECCTVYTPVVSVVVTNPLDGSPISNLGPAIQASLPAGWVIRRFNDVNFATQSAPPSTVPVHLFRNMGNGIYVMHLGSSPEDQTFGNGQGHYTVDINVSVEGQTYRGIGLGVFP